MTGGFTLVELLIVVTIIPLIVGALAAGLALGLLAPIGSGQQARRLRRRPGGCGEFHEGRAERLILYDESVTLD